MKTLCCSKSGYATLAVGQELRHVWQCKVVAHVGFLVEACVEAIPQSVLQLVAMQHAGEVSFFSVLSIILSISCLASKGYIASFSVHFRTFVFNALCIAADVVLPLGLCAL